MKKEGEHNRVTEQLLFHGTQKDVVDAICKNNIDWRFSGKHNTTFGQGKMRERAQHYPTDRSLLSYGILEPFH